jgi:hypothetical protein
VTLEVLEDGARHGLRARFVDKVQELPILISRCGMDLPQVSD